MRKRADCSNISSKNCRSYHAEEHAPALTQMTAIAIGAAAMSRMRSRSMAPFRRSASSASTSCCRARSPHQRGPAPRSQTGPTVPTFKCIQSEKAVYWAQSRIDSGRPQGTWKAKGTTRYWTPSWLGQQLTGSTPWRLRLGGYGPRTDPGKPHPSGQRRGRCRLLHPSRHAVEGYHAPPSTSQGGEGRRAAQCPRLRSRIQVKMTRHA